MPRKSKRKTEEIKRAATDGKCGKSIRSVAKDRNIDRLTLRRYIKRKKSQQKKSYFHDPL